MKGGIAKYFSPPPLPGLCSGSQVQAWRSRPVLRGRRDHLRVHDRALRVLLRMQGDGLHRRQPRLAGRNVSGTRGHRVSRNSLTVTERTAKLTPINAPGFPTHRMSLGTSDNVFISIRGDHEPTPQLTGHVWISPTDRNDYMALIWLRDFSILLLHKSPPRDLSRAYTVASSLPLLF